MFDEQAVIILGAGASIPYGFPSGKELRKRICDSFVEKLKKYLPHAQSSYYLHPDILFKAEEFVERFRNSSNISIDLFLSRNTNFRKIGKTAILLEILDAEAQSKFHEDVINAEHDWYSFLFEQMTDELTGPENYNISPNKIFIITFNYDRSLEHFLFNSVINSFGDIEQHLLIDELKKIPIIHVYGKLADLHWQNKTDSLAYGQNSDVLIPDNYLTNINVIYEDRDREKYKNIHAMIADSKYIYFLGFGYARENLQVLSLPEILKPNQHIYGTAFGYYEEEITKLSKRFLRDKKLHNLRFMNCDNLELLRRLF